MKKRLLSAALALAMVLTMLPLTAFATPGAGATVTYYAAGKVRTSSGSTAPDNSAGWFYDTGNKTADGKGNIYEEVTGGVICSTGTSGKWYSAADDALTTGKATQLKLLDSSQTIDLTKATGSSLSIDVNGNNVEINASELNSSLPTTDPNKTTITTVTVTNSAKNPNGTQNKTPALSGSITAKNQNFTFTASNATGTGALSIELQNETTSAKTLKVTLTDAKVDDLTTDRAGLSLTATANTVDAAETGDIKVNDNNGSAPANNLSFDPGNTTINVAGGKTGDITVNGEGSITLNGKATAGDITLNTGKKYTSGSSSVMPKWGGNFRVDINSQCTVNSIAEATGGCDGIITVNANTGSTVTNGIDLSKSATAHVVKVDGGKVGPVSMNAGTLTIQNSATVGAVTLGTAQLGGKLTANISGGKIDGLTVNGGEIDPTVNISGGTFTAAVALPSGYSKKTITGGTFKTSLAANSGWLNNVSYEIYRSASDTFTYTNSFQDCVNAYKIANDTLITMVGSRGTCTAHFTMGSGTQTETIVDIKTDAAMPIILPTTVNGKSVGTWYVGGVPKSAGYPFRLTGNVTISASETATDDSQIASVKVDYSGGKNSQNPGLTAVLSGTTIKVSGALRSNYPAGEAITLKVTTALGNEWNVDVAFYPALDGKKQLLFAGGATGTGNPIQDGNTPDTLMLKGNTTVYTLDGSGLVVSADIIRPVGTSATTASVSGVSLGTAEKAALETLLKGTTASALHTSPAIQEAVNKIVAGLSQSQVDSYIRQGKIAKWKETPGNTGTPNDSQLSTVSGWKYLHVSVYLNVQVTSWNRQSNNQSMTLNITPYYSLMLSNDANSIANGSVTVKTGTALPMTGVTADYGGIAVTLPFTLLDADFMKWAHHGDYVYQINSSGEFTTTHGFSPFVINGTQWNAKRTGEDDSGRSVNYYYDNVQTAIDETGYGDHDQETVTLRDYYGKTAETYSISGKARTFTFDPGNNGTFVPTFSGANTTADKTNGNVWTVQLNADSVVNNASISVKTASNGSATINLTSAKPGASVSGTYTANSGYKAGAFTATAQPGNKSVTVNVAANGTFSFTVPADATSVTVTPSFVLDTGLPFTDVPASAWYFDGVKYCYNTTKNGYRVMEGFSSTQFGADRAYTRAEVVTILWNLKGRPTPGAATRAYTDVNSGHWAYNAIVWATNNGYAEGYPNGSFQPSSSVTREEMVVFLWRAAGKPTTYNSINLNGFADGYNVHDWGLSAMKWAVALNILSGQNSVSLNGTLAARTTAYRREVAVTVMNFDKLNLF